MVNPSRFASNPRIDKPWGSTLREKLPRSVRLRYVNWGSKECQQSCRYADWISNIVPIEKKDSGKFRVCFDFRDLNKATPKDEYLMPIADMLINEVSGHRVISFLDGNAGYNQIFMAEEDISKTAF